MIKLAQLHNLNRKYKYIKFNRQQIKQTLINDSIKFTRFFKKRFGQTFKFYIKNSVFRKSSTL